MTEPQLSKAEYINGELDNLSVELLILINNQTTLSDEDKRILRINLREPLSKYVVAYIEKYLGGKK